ncbi:trypsin-like [Plutella xylostella]|uniref:trypsin-like n=1 Tax=Plutella xylostella TaxID=51655 RepID=UPI002032D341|nr:trypsin-like [Plutella xylostella]
MVLITGTLFLLAATAATAFQPPTTFIVGGDNATIEAYPSAVQLEVRKPLTGEWILICGATILSERWVVSAAHCLAPIVPIVGLEGMRSRAGSNIRGEGGQVTSIKSYLVHPEYSIVSVYDADIALAQLERPLTWSDAVQPAPINAFGNELPDESAVQVVGWGDTLGENLSSEDDYADILQQVTLYTISNAECRRRYSDVDIITDNMICADDQGLVEKDACNGDSGGPMYYKNRDTQILVGIVSFGPLPCPSPLKPAGFVKVSAYTNWIVENAV